MRKPIDITNQKFGMLTAKILLPERKRGLRVWRCECDCGKEKDVVQSSLTSGNTKSCGCLQKKNGILQGKNRLQDLTNQKFGKWTVLQIDLSKTSGHKYWICQCDCGTIRSVDGNTLRKGSSVSCGCQKFSKGEEKITFLLNQANIPFEAQWTKHTCVFPDSYCHAKFDFYVNNKYVIEFDGRQHFEYTGLGWDNQKNFEDRQYKDNYKNNWCKQNNIPIIRIPYTHLSKLTIQDLQIETSQFII